MFEEYTLTVSDVQKKLGKKAAKSVYDYVNHGLRGHRLPAKKFGRNLKFRQEDLERWVTEIQ